jgi:uroporphyrinogen-III decarboxylase
MKEDIIKNFQIGKTKNHFILGTTHELQFTMPDENMKAIFETVGEIQRGKIL